MHGVKLFTGAAVSVLLLALAGPTPALADTIDAALVRAYQTNPQLNAQRAQVRSTDENVPQALSGYRPTVALSASGGIQYSDQQSSIAITSQPFFGVTKPRSVGVNVTQTLYNGNITGNRTRAAESQVPGSSMYRAGTRRSGSPNSLHPPAGRPGPTMPASTLPFVPETRRRS